MISRRMRRETIKATKLEKEKLRGIRMPGGHEEGEGSEDVGKDVDEGDRDLWKQSP